MNFQLPEARSYGSYSAIQVLEVGTPHRIAGSGIPCCASKERSLF